MRQLDNRIPRLRTTVTPAMGDFTTIDGSDQDLALSKSEFLTRQEVLRRRSRRVKQLARLYKTHYWNLMEELKRKHKEYYWFHGKSPFKEDEKKSSEQTDGNKLGGLGFQFKCQISDCKEKPMALTRFCHRHILHDSNQILYRGCNYPIKRLVLFFFFYNWMILRLYVFFFFSPLILLNIICFYKFG